MPARFAQLAIASLLAGSVGLRAAEGEASVKLTGIAHFNNRSRALLEIQTQPGRPVIKPILAEGERVADVEVKEIDAQSGRVRVTISSVETFYLLGSGKTVPAGRSLHFKSADLAQVLEIYQEISCRTVLRPSSLPGAKVDLQTDQLSNADILRAIDQLLVAKNITTCPRGDKFVFVARADQTNQLSLIPDPPAASSGGEVFPAGLIKFMEADVSQVLEICQELRQRTLLKPSNLPYAKISVRSQTEMTRDQAIWMLDATLALADIAMIPHGKKLCFVLPGIENRRVPDFEPNPLSPIVNAQDVFPAGLIRFQSADPSQVLPVYATLIGRKPVPADRTTPAAKLTISTQTELTRAEAVFALDAIAAINRLKFALVEDDKVAILPAALAHRETNPVQ